MIQLTNQLIDTKTCLQLLENNSAGALVTFEGWVRNHNEGKNVKLLEYEASEILCKKEYEKIAAEAKRNFEIINIQCIHRTGKINIGEVAVFIGVIAVHRGDAFKACNYIIDEIKKRLPIWKKETYEDGSSSWVNCQTDVHIRNSNVEFSENDYYTKQIILPEIRQDGQTKLRNSSVLVIGAGGLGSSALIYLACAGIGTIGICDFDIVDASNLHRQILFDKNTINSPKVEIARNSLKDLNPFINIKVYQEAITANTKPDFFDDYDLILDCTDNMESKLVINDFAITKRKPIIQASIYQWEGQIHGWSPLSSKGQCLRCLWDTDSLKSSKLCTQSGVIGSVAGVLGTIQATEAIKFLLGVSSPLKDKVVLLNLITLETQMIKAIKNADCPICIYRVQEKKESKVLAYEVQIVNQDELNAFKLIDVISLIGFENKLDPKTNYLIYCLHGISSYSQVLRLRQLGYTNVYSLQGGLEDNSIVRQWLTKTKEGVATV